MILVNMVMGKTLTMGMEIRIIQVREKQTTGRIHRQDQNGAAILPLPGQSLRLDVRHPKINV